MLWQASDPPPSEIHKVAFKFRPGEPSPAESKYKRVATTQAGQLDLVANGTSLHSLRGKKFGRYLGVQRTSTTVRLDQLGRQ